MIQVTSVYYDLDEMTPREAFYATCDAVKHRPREGGGLYTRHSASEW